MWESCANKQLHFPINVIFQSDISGPKLLLLRQLSIPAQSPDCHVRAAAKLLLNSSENGGDKLVHGSGGISQPRAE